MVITGFGGLMRDSRTASLQRSNEEQLLAKLVRLIFLQSPYFLEVDGITTPISINTEANAEFQHA